MKKLFITLLTCILLLNTQMVFANNPSLVRFLFMCPVATGHGTFTLINTTTTIEGVGREVIMEKRTPNNPLFSYTIPAGAHLPANIITGGYNNTGASYDPTTGTVSCQFTSRFGFDSFAVTFTSSDLKDGMLIFATERNVRFQKFIG